MSDNTNPHPRYEPTSIEIDPPTEYVLIDVLSNILQGEPAVEEPYEKAAVGRLLSSLEGNDKPKGELTESVRENTVLDGLPGHLCQEALFEHYDEIMANPAN